MARSAPVLACLAALLLAVPALQALPEPTLPDPTAINTGIVDHVTTEHATDAVFRTLGLGSPIDSIALQDTIPADRVFAHDASGFVPIPASFGSVFDFTVSHVGMNGPEPSIGADAAGRIYFQAFIQTLRSDDGGLSWLDITPASASPVTYDPYLWLDPDTGRLFNNQLSPLAPVVSCSWSVWTDTSGVLDAAWQGVNPRFCAGSPEFSFVDHQKVHTGKVPPGFNFGGVHPTPVGYDNAVFFSWNDGANGNTAMSLDGGLTFPFTAQTSAGTCSGGLHGRPRSFSDGTLLVPKRDCNQPRALRSSNFNTWTSVPLGAAAGVTDHRKNPDAAIDTGDNAFMFWSGRDERTYMSASADKGLTWGAPVRASPPNVLSSTFQASVAGAPGRVAVMYFGNDHEAFAPDHAEAPSKWHAYISMTLNGLDANPTWVTWQLDTDADPIQVGAISTNSHHAPAGSRNLLDFNDLRMTQDGRLLAAYADGCTSRSFGGAVCANNPTAQPQNSRDREGVAAILNVGPNLLG